MSLILDTGALIAFERGARTVQADMSRPRATSRPPRSQSAVRVQVAELKARLSQSLRTAEAGQTVVVTAYGRPVVDLVPRRSRGGTAPGSPP